MLKKPHVILKYAKSSDNYIGQQDKSIWLTNQYSKRLVHKWRSEVDSILVGSGTVRADDPKLTTRFNFGKNPVRVVLDRKLKLSMDYVIFNNEAKTIVFTNKDGLPPNTKQLTYISPNLWQLEEILSLLSAEGIKSIIIEGGQKILNSFVNKGLWDEARVFTAKKEIFSGLEAPNLNCKPIKEFKILTDTLQIFRNPKLIR